MDSYPRSPPYPVDQNFVPEEALEALQRMRQNYLNHQTPTNPDLETSFTQQAQQAPVPVPVPGPPLPSRPPQYIIDQHIPVVRHHPPAQPNTIFSTPERASTHQSSNSASRLQGPREFPSRFSNDNLNFTLSNESNSVYSPHRTYNTPYPSDCPVGSGYYDQFASSPRESLTSLDQSQIFPSNTSPIPSYYSSPSLKRSPERNKLVAPRLNALDTKNLQDTSISSLPDVPQMLSNSIFSSPTYTERENSVRSRHNSPTPFKGSLFGPRMMPTRTSLSQHASPSTSPNKTYYDHRTSWKSEYSLNVIETDDEEDHDEDPFGDVQRIDIPNNESTEPTMNKFPNLGQFSFPDISLPKAPLDKDLPPVPSTLELPTLPFSARVLKKYHFDQCSNVSLLSDIFKWSLQLTEDWSEGLLVTQEEYKNALKALITSKVIHIRPFVMTKYVDNILKSFERQNSVYIDEHQNIHFFANVKTQGVLPALTPCYSYLHVKEPITSYSCYSSRCPWTMTKPAIPHAPPKESVTGKIGEWVSYWNLTQQDLQELDEDEIRKQSHIFELIRQQQNIIKLGEIQIKIYGNSFKTTTPQLLPDISRFYNDAFNSVKPLIELHKKHLLELLINKLNSQGKYISGIGEIFLNWTRLCSVQYLKYTEQMVSVRELIKYEKSKKSAFSQWLLSIDSDPRVVDAGLDHNRIFFSGFTGHTQSLALVLSSVYKKTKESDEDHQMLKLAIEAIDKLNKKIDETQGTVLESRELKILSRQLSWRNTIMETDLNLLEPNRKIIKRDQVQRKDKWSVSTNLLILLDSYLLIAEQRDNSQVRIVEKPIPIEFLQVETKDIPQTPTIEDSETDITYPFVIRHAGQNLSYRFFTETLKQRDSWIHAFNRVKQTKRNNSPSEAYEIKVLSDQFQYPDGLQPQKLPICVPGSNIDSVLKAFNPVVEDELNVPRPVMVSEVLCGTTIYFENESYHVLGLQFGLFITNSNNARGWRRVLDMAKITQVDQLQNLLILISDKALYYFSIVSLLLNYNGMNSDDAIVGERLSKHGVALFKIGAYYNTTLLFVLKTPLQSTIQGPKFKVFSPVFNRIGKFEQFQLYKRFQIPNDCYDISIFNSMFVLHTSKGFEILSFQVLNDSQFIPKFIESSKKPKTEIEQIKRNLKLGNCKPLKMVKVQNRPQFYLIYDTFAMVIDTIGQLVSDKFIFPFKFKCSSVSMQDEFLICIVADIVEIFDLSYDEFEGFEKFSPIQIITGKDIKLLDEKNSKICIAHPVFAGRQLVLQLDRIK